MNSKVRRRILTAILVSLVMHFSFLVWSYFAKILPAVPFPEKAESVFHVRIEKQEMTGAQQKLKFETETSLKTPKPENPFTQDMVARPSIESEELVKNNIESSIRQNKQALIPSSMKEDQLIRKSEFNDVVMTRKVRRAPRENLVEIGEVPHEDFASGSPVLISGDDISKSFLDKSAIPADASMAAPVKSANTQNEFQLMKQTSLGAEHQSKSTDLGTALTYQLLKYEDPAGQKYFKLIVKVRDATINFPIIPKEIIFLLDASGSIGMDRLSQFISGISYSLRHLNPHDRFNIIVFKNKTINFSGTPLEPTRHNIEAAVNFLQELKSWSTTDIYGALRDSLKTKDNFVPSYRVIMTDGYPTTGIVDAMHVINEISRINDNKVSMFTFGGGTSVDPYMLDFIAFKNRGWSRIIGRTYQIANGFEGLYNEIKDPLLLNVRYYVSGLNEKQIFPQTMPDFFKGSQFVVYGKYTDENKFVMQVRGEVAHENKEFIVSASLSQALAGDKSIARDWAFHKVYYLIGKLKYHQNNEALFAEIQGLCAKFHIITPYSISYRQAHPATRKAVVRKSRPVKHAQKAKP